MVIQLPISKKSLYSNIYNDNKIGHTATVSTVIKQGKSINTKLSQVYRIPKQIDFKKKYNLIDKLLRKSKAITRINNVFVFSDIAVNGKKIDTKYQFCFFTKEETDKTKVQYGRIKLHYPITLKYEDEDLLINNRKVLRDISKALNDYAFIVNSFDFDFETEILNFDCQIVGEPQILQSKVFIIGKGVGKTFNTNFFETFDNYDDEVQIIRKKVKKEVSPENYIELLKERKNHLIDNLLTNKLKSLGYNRIINVSKTYPYSLYDIESYYEGKKRFFIVKTTALNKKVFDLSLLKYTFFGKFKENTSLILCTNAYDNPDIDVYAFENVERFNKKINSLRFYDE